MNSTGERIYPGHFESVADYVLYLKHLFAYEFAKLQIKGGSKILDVGCGEGYGTAVLSQSGSTVIGLDVDQAVIDNANRMYRSERCSYKHFDGTRLSFEDGTFDSVVSFQVIEHVQNDVAFLREIKRVMKTGGALYLTTPSRSYRLRPEQAPWNKFHLREYNRSDLDHLLGRVFDNVKIYGVTATPPVREIEIRRVYSNRFKHPISGAIRRGQQLRDLILSKRMISLSEAMTEFMSEDFFVVDHGIDDCLDLYGICFK